MLLKAIQYFRMLTAHFLFTRNHTFKGTRELNSTAICDLWEFLAFSPFRHPSLTDGAQSHKAIHNSSLYHKFLVPPPPPNACLMVARLTSLCNNVGMNRDNLRHFFVLALENHFTTKRRSGKADEI